MNPVQIHLMLNHVPVLGTAFVVLALGAGALLRNGTLIRFGLGVLVVVALTAVAVLFTGSSAEDRIEHLPGVSGRAIEAHEDVARPATIGLGVLGLLALASLVLSRRRAPSRAVATGMLALTLACGGVMAWTAHLGGMIRHPELQTTAGTGGGAERSGGEEADDD
jgi:uncharacterized membrane protein